MSSNIIYTYIYYYIIIFIKMNGVIVAKKNLKKRGQWWLDG